MKSVQSKWLAGIVAVILGAASIAVQAAGEMMP